MRAFDREVVEAVWSTVEPMVPRPVDDHPKGGHRPRASDRVIFQAILIRLVTGCSWVDAEALCGWVVSDTTIRARRDEWLAAGVFDDLVNHALHAYDRIIGLDLDEVAIDGSQHKAPCGGEGVGPNPTDRARGGWKWSIGTERHGIPVGWAIDGANRHDIMLFQPTLEAIGLRGLLADIETIHLDKGYDCARVRDAIAAAGIDDAVIARRRKKGDPPAPKVGLGLRWPVERTNSWMTNFGQLRRNTDKRTGHRHAQIALAITILLTAKLIDWSHRWSPKS